jgi:hypothetical protein
MLFMISGGDYLTDADNRTSLQSVVVIEAPNVNSPQIRRAVDYFAACTQYTVDEVVINKLDVPCSATKEPEDRCPHCGWCDAHEPSGTCYNCGEDY